MTKSEFHWLFAVTCCCWGTPCANGTVGRADAACWLVGIETRGRPVGGGLPFWPWYSAGVPCWYCTGDGPPRRGEESWERNHWPRLMKADIINVFFDPPKSLWQWEQIVTKREQLSFPKQKVQSLALIDSWTLTYCSSSWSLLLAWTGANTISIATLRLIVRLGPDWHPNSWCR